MSRLFLKELIHVPGGAIEHDLDVLVSSLPWISKDFPALCLERSGNCVPKPIESLAQRASPFLIPVGMAAGVASTIAIPALHAVRTTPRAALPDLCLMSRRMLRKVLAVVD